ncbi:MAG: PstA family ABC transporter permease [Myxococcota bacterium]
MRHRLFAVATRACAVGIVAMLVGIVGLLARDGLAEVDLAFLAEAPREAGRAGGIGSLVVATIGVLAIGIGVATPLGLACAVWLAEYGGGRWALRSALDVLAAVPSIVYGLVGMAVFCEGLGLGWSLWSGGLTVAVMILPLLVRLGEEGLRAVPDSLRTAGAALGLPRWRLLLKVLLPEAAPAFAAALVLATGRVLAESAALLLTAGSSLRMPDGPGSPGRVLALHVYTMAVDVPGGSARAAATGLVLVAVIAACSALATRAPALLLRVRA